MSNQRPQHPVPPTRSHSATLSAEAAIRWGRRWVGVGSITLTLAIVVAVILVHRGRHDTLGLVLTGAAGLLGVATLLTAGTGWMLTQRGLSVLADPDRDHATRPPVHPGVVSHR